VSVNFLRKGFGAGRAGGNPVLVESLERRRSIGPEPANDTGRLTTLVYRKLHGTARRHMKGERAPNALQTTGLANDIYLRLVDVQNIEGQHRAQFFGLAAQLMHRILIDAARTRRQAGRRRDSSGHQTGRYARSGAGRVLYHSRRTADRAGRDVDTTQAM
jgi:hypothetical protein